MNLTLSEFPEVIRQVEVGRTFHNRIIPGYMLGTGFSEEWEAEALRRPGLLIMGAHHATQFTSIAQSVYTILHLLFDYVEGDAEVQHMLATSTIFFIPVINLDAYDEMGKIHHEKG